MRYKIIALTVAVIMLLSVAAMATFTDISTESPVGIAVEQLTKLGILNGFDDGSFRPNDTLTRAQFAKIAVYMLGESKSAASYAGSSAFGDVPASMWASGYINYIASKDIINGYPNGTFGANDVVNYAQALTILVRMLGYTGEDVGYRWPDGYISRAQALGITNGITFDKYENVTRANAAYLAYNTLLADKKEGSTDVKLLSSTSREDVVIYADQSIDASVAADNIVTTDGTYKLASSSSISTSDFGMLGTLYFDSDSKAVAFVPEKETKKSVTVISAAKNNDTNKVELTYKENGQQQSGSFAGTTPVYYDGKSSSLEAVISEMENGRQATLFYTENGNFARMLLDQSSIEGPFTVTGDYNQLYSLFNLSQSSALNIYRKGEKAQISDIATYDVVYYARSINTVYAYTDKVTGTYEKASPIKANVTGVTVSGTEYKLSAQNAINKMNESDGAFKIGDRVTLLLGRNGDVIDVVDLNATGILDIVVLTDSYSEISEDTDTLGQRIRYIEVVMPDGSNVTYEADDDYTDYIGNVMKITYSGGIAKLNYITPKVIYGAYDASVPSLNGHWLSSDCCILELLDNPEGEKATVKKVALHELVATDFSRSQVLHVQTSGAMEDITFLYIKDVTKSASEFGVIRTSEKNNRYSLLCGNSEKTVSTALKVTTGDAVELQTSSDNTVSVKTMFKLATGSSVSAYTTGRIRIGTQTFNVDENVKIYGGVTADKFASMSTEEMLDSDNTAIVTLYSDKTAKSGGIVRAIVIKTKK